MEQIEDKPTTKRNIIVIEKLLVKDSNEISFLPLERTLIHIHMSESNNKEKRNDKNGIHGELF